jgi:hypothetical protein
LLDATRKYIVSTWLETIPTDLFINISEHSFDRQSRENMIEIVRTLESNRITYHTITVNRVYWREFLVWQYDGIRMCVCVCVHIARHSLYVDSCYYWCLLSRIDLTFQQMHDNTFIGERRIRTRERQHCRVWLISMLTHDSIKAIFLHVKSDESRHFFFSIFWH